MTRVASVLFSKFGVCCTVHQTERGDEFAVEVFPFTFGAGLGGLFYLWNAANFTIQLAVFVICLNGSDFNLSTTLASNKWRSCSTRSNP